jgi:hypothetical protein
VKQSKWGRIAFRRRIQPLLYEKNIADRKKFGTMVREQGYLGSGRLAREKRAGIFFSDKSWIELFGQAHPYKTEKKSDVPPCLKPKNGLKVMIAGGFYSRGVSELHVVP